MVCLSVLISEIGEIWRMEKCLEDSMVGKLEKKVISGEQLERVSLNDNILSSTWYFEEISIGDCRLVSYGSDDSLYAQNGQELRKI